MLTIDEFEMQISRLYDTFGKTVNQKQLAEWFVEIRSFDSDTLSRTITQLKRESEKFPSLATFIQALSANEKKEGVVKSHWTGEECDACDDGCIYFTKVINGNSYSYMARCPKCKSYKVNWLPFYDHSMEENFYEKQ